MLISIINWLEDNQQPCFYKKNFGVECPGCGMQRAFIYLLKGNVLESIIVYPPLLPILILFLFLFLHLLFKFEKGGIMIKYLFIFVFIIIVINYILKFFI